MEESVGKQYSLKGLLHRVANKESFFCSELVVAAFVVMGLLEEKVHDNLYLPGIANAILCGVCGSHLFVS